MLMEKAQQDVDGDPAKADDASDIVRKDMMLHFGAFITESSGHLSEYLPYYRKRKDLIEKYTPRRLRRRTSASMPTTGPTGARTPTRTA